MMKMKIKLDEQKVKENGEYTVDEMYKKIAIGLSLMLKSGYGMKMGK